MGRIAQVKSKIQLISPKLPTLNIPKLLVQIRGKSPLHCHHMSKEVKEGIIKGAPPKSKKTPKPEDIWRESLYMRSDGSYGHPATAIKKAMASVMSLYGNARKYNVPKILKTIGVFDADRDELIKINGEPRMWTGVTKNAAGQTVGVVCAEFPEWTANVLIRFDGDTWHDEEILMFLLKAGEFVGIGAHRVEKGGQYGQFELVGPEG